MQNEHVGAIERRRLKRESAGERSRKDGGQRCLQRETARKRSGLRGRVRRNDGRGGQREQCHGHEHRRSGRRRRQELFRRPNQPNTQRSGEADVTCKVATSRATSAWLQVPCRTRSRKSRPRGRRTARSATLSPQNPARILPTPRPYPPPRSGAVTRRREAAHQLLSAPAPQSSTPGGPPVLRPPWLRRRPPDSSPHPARTRGNCARSLGSCAALRHRARLSPSLPLPRAKSWRSHSMCAARRR